MYKLRYIYDNKSIEILKMCNRATSKLVKFKTWEFLFINDLAGTANIYYMLFKVYDIWWNMIFNKFNSVDLI